MLIIESGSVLLREQAAHIVLVDVDAEEMGDLLGDAHTAAIVRKAAPLNGIDVTLYEFAPHRCCASSVRPRAGSTSPRSG
jgi:hypothetical protein